MIEWPSHEDFVEGAFRRGEMKARRKSILIVLVARFGPTAESLKVELEAVEYDRLEDLLDWAMDCPDLQLFRQRLLS